MDKIRLIVLLFAVLPNMAYAGHGTIRETDAQFFIEYEGDANETIAEAVTRDKEEKLQVQEATVKAKEVERIVNLSESHAKLKELRRARFNEGNEE
jgi:hypothetical protein